MSGANSGAGAIREELSRVGAQAAVLAAKSDVAAELLRELKADLGAARKEAREERELLWVAIRDVKHQSNVQMQVLSLRTENLERISERMTGLVHEASSAQKTATESLRVDMTDALRRQEESTKDWRRLIDEKLAKQEATMQKMEGPLNRVVSLTDRGLAVFGAAIALATILWTGRDAIWSTITAIVKSAAK